MESKKWIKRNWQFILALSVPLFVFTVLVIVIFSLNREKLSLPLILTGLLLLTSLIPLLYIAYRDKIVEEYVKELHKTEENEVIRIFGLTWRNYAIPISLLSTMILMTVGSLMALDMFDHQGVGGAYFSLSHGLKMPTSVLYFGFSGALIYVLQDMMRRYTIRDLTPRFYFSGFVRIVLSMVASVLLFTVIQANMPVYDFDKYIRPVDKRTVYWLFPLCFTAGLFPAKTFEFVVKSVSKWLSGLTLGKFPGIDDFSINILYIDGINPITEARLNEEGIHTAQNLATSELFVLAEKTPYPISTIADWQDQAMFLCCLGKDNVKPNGNNNSTLNVLKQNGLGRFSDLVYLSMMDEGTPAYKELERSVSQPGILAVLRQKGNLISRQMAKTPDKDARVSAFKVWHLNYIKLKNFM